MAVTPDNIRIALGRTDVSVTEQEQWEMWIADAAMLIEARKDALAIVPDLDQAKLDYVVRAAVVAHVRRPDDARAVAGSRSSTSGGHCSG